VASSIDIVVHCELARNGLRRVVEILATSGQVSGALIEASTIFTVQRGALAATGSYPTKTTKFRAAGYDLSSVLSESFVSPQPTVASQGAA
jgi:pilus assembly protein CpaF